MNFESESNQAYNSDSLQRQLVRSLVRAHLLKKKTSEMSLIVLHTEQQTSDCLNMLLMNLSYQNYSNLAIEREN